MKPLFFSQHLFPGLVGLVFLGVAIQANAGASVPVKALAGKTHFHGIAVDPTDSMRLYLATHHGFFQLTMDGMATRLSDNENDYMGFTPHPLDPSVFYASGHPKQGGNTGFIESRDAGRTWKQLSAGVGGPVDFHQMDVSRVDPKTIYGVYGGLQVSKDGGLSWARKGKLPPDLLDLAASANTAGTLYAATRNGLLISSDEGQSWRDAHSSQRPATMVQGNSDGSMYSYIWGIGLLRSAGDSLKWETLSNNFGKDYFLHLAVDPTNANNLYAITNNTEILRSHDGGASWSAIQ